MSLLIKNATIINEGYSFEGSVSIHGERIHEVYPSGVPLPDVDEVVDARGKWLIPGAVDGHVHFREPGALHKGSIATESAAAVAGGVTSYMDMPNNDPPCCSNHLLKEKIERAAACSYANYAFYLGVNGENFDEIQQINPAIIPGIKVFMGASTGNMLVDKMEVLEQIFKESPVLIATHCEDEDIILKNLSAIHTEILPSHHPVIRSREACLRATEKAISLALKYNSRLHILHLTTKEEVELLTSIQKISPAITGEVCVHHLFFTDQDYQTYGNLIKCNPAIKSIYDRDTLRESIRKGVIQVVGTDHAPHTLDEKQRPYLSAPSGLPMIQHSLPLMFGFALMGIFTPEQVVTCMCHGPALNFGVRDRGFIRKGYYADLVLIDPKTPTHKAFDTLLYKCGWSPLVHTHIPVGISHTFVNGHLAWSSEKGLVNRRYAQPLDFIHHKIASVE
jgi:dihydroorotase